MSHVSKCLCHYHRPESPLVNKHGFLRCLLVSKGVTVVLLNRTGRLRPVRRFYRRSLAEFLEICQLALRQEVPPTPHPPPSDNPPTHTNPTPVPLPLFSSCLFLTCFHSVSFFLSFFFFFLSFCSSLSQHRLCPCSK